MKTAHQKALAFLKDLQKLLKRHPDVYSLVINLMDREQLGRKNTDLWLELDVYDDTTDEWGDPDKELNTPLHIEIEPGNCLNLYDHSLAYIIKCMEEHQAGPYGACGSTRIRNPWEAEDAERKAKEVAQ